MLCILCALLTIHTIYFVPFSHPAYFWPSNFLQKYPCLADAFQMWNLYRMYQPYVSHVTPDFAEWSCDFSSVRPPSVCNSFSQDFNKHKNFRSFFSKNILLMPKMDKRGLFGMQNQHIRTFLCIFSLDF